MTVHVKNKHVKTFCKLVGFAACLHNIWHTREKDAWLTIEGSYNNVKPVCGLWLVFQRFFLFFLADFHGGQICCDWRDSNI